MVHDPRCRRTGSGVSVSIGDGNRDHNQPLKEVAVPAVLAFTAAGISGWLLARKARDSLRSLSVVTAVESGSLGGMTRAAVGNVTPFSRISPTAASCPLGDQTGKSGGRVRQGSIPPINGVLTAPGTVWPQPVRRGT